MKNFVQTLLFVFSDGIIYWIYFKIIVHGDEASTIELSNHCMKSQIEKIFTPRVGEVVDATNETQIYQVTAIWQKST